MALVLKGFLFNAFFKQSGKTPWKSLSKVLYSKASSFS